MGEVIYLNVGRALGSKRAVAFDQTKLGDMHRHVLLNCGMIELYLK